MRDKLVLIDGHSILNRAFYGVPDFTNSEGTHTNAIFGFLNILFKIIDEENPNIYALHLMYINLHLGMKCTKNTRVQESQCFLN